jgi:hypothetical protein
VTAAAHYAVTLVTRPTKSRAASQRRYRRREREGRRVLAIEVNETDWVLKLIEVGLLCARDADDRNAVRTALERQIALLCRFPA